MSKLPEQDNTKTDVALAGQAERCVMQWLPIETAPQQDETEILLTCATGDMAIAYWSKKLGFWTWGLGKEFRRPTHWMPLPNAPIAA